MEPGHLGPSMGNDRCTRVGRSRGYGADLGAEELVVYGSRRTRYWDSSGYAATRTLVGGEYSECPAVAAACGETDVEDHKTNKQIAAVVAVSGAFATATEIPMLAVNNAGIRHTKALYSQLQLKHRSLR